MGEDMLDAAIKGDKSAFSALLSDHYHFIFTIAWRWCGIREDAEDITQDVCIRIARALVNFQKQSSFKTWLYTLTLNAVRDFKRKQAREARKRDAWAQEAALDVEGQGDDDPVDVLWAMVRQLPEKIRDTVLLVHAEGLSHAEAGEILACAESTISWRLMEARKMLKQIKVEEVA